MLSLLSHGGLHVNASQIWPLKNLVHPASMDKVCPGQPAKSGQVGHIGLTPCPKTLVQVTAERTTECLYPLFPTQIGRPGTRPRELMNTPPRCFNPTRPE